VAGEQRELKLPEPASAPTRPTHYLGVDPGKTSGWALVGPNEVLLASGSIKDKGNELLGKKLDPVRQELAAARSMGGVVVGALEQMSPAFFKHGAAAAGFHASRGRWEAVFSSLEIGTVVDVHVQTWRRVSGVAVVARSIPRKGASETEVGRVDWKRAAKEWVAAKFGRKASPDEAEAIGIAIAARRIGQDGKDGLVGARRARGAGVDPVRRGRGGRPPRGADR
jgi:hypothetical protein